MIKRIYLFILLGTLIENCYHFWEWAGYSPDFVYYTVFPTCQRAEIALLPIWWFTENLWPARRNEKHELWAYLIAATYFIFQLVDAIDMAVNANQRSAWLDFLLFGCLNITYLVLFTRRPRR